MWEVSSCISALQVILDVPGQIDLLRFFADRQGSYLYAVEVVSRGMQLIVILYIWQFILYVPIIYLCDTGERGGMQLSL